MDVDGPPVLTVVGAGAATPTSRTFFLSPTQLPAKAEKIMGWLPISNLFLFLDLSKPIR